MQDKSIPWSVNPWSCDRWRGLFEGAMSVHLSRIGFTWLDESMSAYPGFVFVQPIKPRHSCFGFTELSSVTYPGCLNPTFVHRAPVGCLKCLGRLGRGREQICSACSAALEAFGAAWTLSAPIQHAKSEEVGCWPSEPLDSLIDGVLANQHGVWEGRNTVCALLFYALRSIIYCFHVLEYWHETSCYVRSGRINLCSFGNASLHV